MRIRKDLCDICGTCVAVCPVDAITVSEFDVHLDENKCILCRNCVIACPVKAIEED
ncbi:MAG: 4Fe-4S binding protein [Candidatus Cloacimonetes bacterium]|nr:4Fe-4S binding protein [Candidatus Cloacimonadota bacterium]